MNQIQVATNKWSLSCIYIYSSWSGGQWTGRLMKHKTFMALTSINSSFFFIYFYTILICSPLFLNTSLGGRNQTHIFFHSDVELRKTYYKRNMRVNRQCHPHFLCSRNKICAGEFNLHVYSNGSLPFTIHK